MCKRLISSSTILLFYLLVYPNQGFTQEVNSNDKKTDTTSRQLEEIQIKKTRSLVRQQIDRLSYDVQGDPEHNTLNGLDLMRKVPMLSVDAAGQLKMRGSTNYRILINGKESGMMAANPRDVLRNLPASAIKRIEVITTPSSKYDGEGPAGFINIILMRRASDGYNGNVRLAHELPTGGPSLGGNLTLKSGKFAIAINGGADRTSTPETAERYYRQTFGSIPEQMENNSTKKNNSRSIFGGAELSFEPDTLNLLTAEFSPYSGYNKVYNSRLFELNEGNPDFSKYLLDARNKYSWTGMTAGLSFQRSFSHRPGQLLTFAYRYVSNDNPQVNHVDISQQINSHLTSFLQQSASGYKEHIFQGDYVRPLKSLTIEAGIKTILRYNSSDYKRTQSDTSLVNNFKNSSPVFGAYNSYHYRIGAWGIKAGYRLEYTTMHGQYKSASQIPKTNYFNLIPALSLMYNINMGSSLTMGYTNRIERPRFYQLDPFADRSITNILSYGNPNLKPALSHHLELNYSQDSKTTFSANLSYTLSNNLIQQISQYDSTANATITTYANTGYDRQLKLYLSAGGKLAEKLGWSANGLISRVWLKGTIEGRHLENSGYNAKMSADVTYTLSDLWKASGSFNIDAPETFLQEKTNLQFYQSLRLYGDLVKDKLNLSLTVNNPFTKFRYYERNLTGFDFKQYYRFQSYNRSFGLSLSWQFGHLESGVQKSKRKITIDDGR
ncbi:outer membrane beta-barrel protein [Pedobacter foliorum]|uniref:outer membrane beta-barrel protein n=1 Tax=Pedobacter foliorum TaxID=2739058 RepID=UPI0015644268|nr:outer membrane beta-barrel protein [Pedobacter foliorum]NRF38025.1 TonB-dependent receptor [Pedobacter foliorum]